MSAENWFDKIKDGDMLRPYPAWNASERQHNQLTDPVKVLWVRSKKVSQSGVVFGVATKSGIVRELDAGWFLPPGKGGEF